LLPRRDSPQDLIAWSKSPLQRPIQLGFGLDERNVAADFGAQAVEALAGPAATCFVLTNTRSMEEPAAAETNVLAARGLLAVAERRGTRLQLVSQSDSTLRGHVMAEVMALDSVCRETAGRGYDGVLLVPAFLEAGRLTAGDIH
jgi:uncharacterized protein YgbK (DUF1537 family)